MIKKHFLFFFLIVIETGCGDHTNNRMILGKWSGAEWLVNGMPSNRNINATHFTFDEKENYTFSYSGNEEKGTYKVENDMLFTKPSGEKEIMVRITKLTADSLVFYMNRGGQDEILTLTRNK